MLQPIYDEKLLAIINSLQPISESEQLDELKKETLGNYIKKANDHSSSAGIIAGGASYGWGNASNDLSRKEKERALRIIEKRKKGITNASDKLVKGQYQESILDKLSVALEYLDEEQLDQVAEVIVDMLDEAK